MILTQAQRLMQDSTRRFAEAEIHPHMRDWERNGRVPREILHKMGQLGLMGMLICHPDPRRIRISRRLPS